MENNELKHYGVLGMRWGVRKRRSGDGDSEDSIRARRALQKNINEMSNKELQDTNQRIRLEQEHKDLIRKQTVGKKAVGIVLATIATANVANNAYKAFAGKDAVARKVYDKAASKVGDYIVKDLAKGLKKPLTN